MLGLHLACCCNNPIATVVRSVPEAVVSSLKFGISATGQEMWPLLLLYTLPYTNSKLVKTEELQTDRPLLGILNWLTFINWRNFRCIPFIWTSPMCWHNPINLYALQLLQQRVQDALCYNWILPKLRLMHRWKHRDGYMVDDEVRQL